MALVVGGASRCRSAEEVRSETQQTNSLLVLSVVCLLKNELSTVGE
jgi:hypothetical protein